LPLLNHKALQPAPGPNRNSRIACNSTSSHIWSQTSQEELRQFSDKWTAEIKICVNGASCNEQARHSTDIPQAMATPQTQLLCTVAARSGRSRSNLNAGILSAVALPQFINQTQTAAATEKTAEASAIINQASLDDLENGNISISSDTDHPDCKDYAGLAKTTNTNFTDPCDGTKDVFAVISKGNLEHNNKDGVAKTIAAGLTERTFKQPVVTGI
jgi:type II secretory pathway pseudopilin PulG